MCQWDYRCKTVGQGIARHCIPDDWCAEFDIYDDAHPIICVPVDKIRNTPAMLALSLRSVENAEEEYASCTLDKSRKVIVFKLDEITPLLKAMEELPV